MLSQEQINVDLFNEVKRKNAVIANMQKRLDYLNEALEDVEVEICLSRNDSAERALNLLQKAKQKDKDFRSELTKRGE